jgi:light-regulated signal transduction histidine kinase (bacteriophytochrome)
MVSSFTQLLARRYKGKLDADADDFIHFAVDGAERMQRLIRDLLAYSRAGRQGQQLAPVDANRAFDLAVANLSMAIQDSGAVVTREALPTVLAEESGFTQIFQNLIGNALKFHRPGVPPQAHVSAQQVTGDGQWLMVNGRSSASTINHPPSTINHQP